MNFGEQIKKLRRDRNLTQQEMAEKLSVSRQAVSNWENDKNLPDIEMLITMSRVFQITLDELILGGTSMNNMTEKLIRDNREGQLAKKSLLGVKIGAGLLALGFVALVAGIWVPYSMEGYFGAAFSLLSVCGLIAFLAVGAANLPALFKSGGAKNRRRMALGGLLVLLGVVLYGVSLMTSAVDSYFGFGAMALGAAGLLWGALTKSEV